MTDHQSDTSSEDTVAALVRRRAAATPNALAVIAADATLNYRDLCARAAELAERIAASGAGPDDLVALCLPRSADFVVGALAILLSGAGYLGLEPDQPEARLRSLLDDSGAALTITTPERADLLGIARPLMPIGADTPASAPPLADTPASAPPPPRADGIAYAVYTSGSTGTPKAVLNEHAALRNLVGWHHDAFGLTAADRCTFLASPGFDAAVWEVWAALTAGASLHVPAEELKKDPTRLRDWLIAERITVSFAPTPLAESLIALRWPADCALRYLLTGGDVLRRGPLPGLPFTLVNNYGLSEAAVVSTSGAVPPGPAERVPGIGRAIAGVTLRVVDEAGVSVPAGVEGELLICGVSVARGYLNRPDLTARRFGADPLDPARRAYRTGDRVRITAAGEVEFVGRLDDQIQIRGLRVEVGEVTARLAARADVTECVVLPMGDADDRYLAAFVVPAADGFNTAAAAAELSAHLPEHMLPRHLLELDRLPVAATGKLDRGALATLLRARADAPAADLPAPRNDVEATLAAVVAEKLKLPAVGVDQNFFLLGGHSMLGAQLIVRIVELYGVEMSLLTLFDNPTVAQMAAEVERLLVAEIEAMSDEAVLDAAARMAADTESGLA